ncbi:hypothetical protein [Streptomyces sp. NPDC048172]|uniref:hypothetical protein n=1 Tax=Streptomyces sp. NPDC048172 TaxID=3365505 RepID=UPI0037145F70
MREPLARWTACAATAVAVTALTALTSGTAHADEYPKNSHNAPRVGLVNAGQIDDPMEDVLEHVLLFGDGYRWD